MSFINVAPELVEAAAQDLAGIGSTLGEATSAAAGPTTGLLAAGADEVSVAIAGLFGSHGQEFQALAARASAFHEQFVSLMNAGAGKYLSTEVANVQQTLTGAIPAPAQALGGGAAGALAHLEGAASTVGQGLGGVAQKVGGAVSALENGGAASLLPGRIESGVQSLSGAFARIPAELKSLESGALLGSPSNLATIAAPYQALVSNTEANLQSIGSALAANPSPVLHQIIDNQIGYGQQIATALQNTGKDLGTGVAGLQTSLQAAGQALQAGNFTGATGDVLQGLQGLLVSGLTVPPVTGTAPIPITTTGLLADLGQFFAVPGEIAQNMANAVKTLTDFSTTLDPTTLGINFGLPLALTLDVLGSPITTLSALGSSAQAISTAMQTGNLVGAIDGLLDAPANIANGFLNGQTLASLPSITLDLGGIPITATTEIPFGGILAPLSPLTAEVFGIPLQLDAGTHIGGIIPALLNFAPEQLAQAIATGTGDM